MGEALKGVSREGVEQIVPAQSWLVQSPSTAQPMPGPRSGARAVVTDESQAKLSSGWIRIAGTGDSYRLLGGS